MYTVIVNNQHQKQIYYVKSIYLIKGVQRLYFANVSNGKLFIMLCYGIENPVLK